MSLNEDEAAAAESPEVHSAPQSLCAPSAEDAAMAAKWKPLIAALIIVALVLRIMAAILVERHVQNAGRAFLIEGDANGYWELAQKIATGQDYAIHQPPRYVLRMPGFPLLLAASIRIFGDNVFAARIVLAIVGTACCWLTYRLGSLVHMRRTGFWAAMFVTINPLHIGNSVLVLSESWFTFWMLLSLLALVKLVDRFSAPKKLPENADEAPAVPSLGPLVAQSCWAGILIGGAVLVRPGFLPWLALAACGVLFLLRRTVAIRSLSAGCMVAGCFVVLFPWAARNAAVTDHWVFTSLWSGPSLYDGWNPDATGASDMRFFDDEQVMAKQGLSEFEMNEHYKQRAFTFAKSNPGRVLELAAIKAGKFLSPTPNATKQAGWVIEAAFVAVWATLAVLAIAGLVSRQWDGVGFLVTVGPLLLFLLVHMVFVGSVRYRLPVEFPLSVMAAIGWRWLVLKRGGSAGNSSPTSPA